MSVPAFNTVTWFQVGTDAPSGGISHEPDASRNHAMFLVLVEDVEAACEQTVKCGGKVAMPALTTVSGLTFDPSGPFR